MANCVASVADLFHRTERGKYQGLVGTAFGIPSVAGPVVGGYVTSHFAWNWVFLINVPAGIVVLLMLLRFPGTDADTQNMRLDHLGMATLTLAVVPSMFAFSWAGAHHAWGSSQWLDPWQRALRWPACSFTSSRRLTIQSCPWRFTGTAR